MNSSPAAVAPVSPVAVVPARAVAPVPVPDAAPEPVLCPAVPVVPDAAAELAANPAESLAIVPVALPVGDGGPARNARVDYPSQEDFENLALVNRRRLATSKFTNFLAKVLRVERADEIAGLDRQAKNREVSHPVDILVECCVQ